MRKFYREYQHQLAAEPDECNGFAVAPDIETQDREERRA
jgi:hypothetical protein